MAKYASFITRFKALHPGQPYSDSILMDWLNELDGSVWAKIQRPKAEVTLSRTAGQLVHALPTGVAFHRIENVYVSNVEYPRIDVTANRTTGYYETSTGIGIYPAAASTDVTPSVKIVHLPAFTNVELTAAATADALIEDPFSQLYLLFMDAKMEFAQKQFATYSNLATVFNMQIDEYLAWYNERKPIGRRDTKCGFQLPVITQNPTRKTGT